MKKTFKLMDPKIKPERQVEAIKHEVKKYLKRERSKKIPDGTDYWDFDCKIGENADNAKPIFTSEINKSIDLFVQNKNESFYLEILAKPGHHVPKEGTPPKKTRPSS